MKPLRHSLAVLTMMGVAVLLTLPKTALPQADSGGLDGRVFDESRAAVPGAIVTAKNPATGVTRSANVSSGGTYHIASLPAGTYTVTVELAGFVTASRTGVEVLIGSPVNVDFTMKVGGQSETITVTGETPLIQTTTSDVGQVITSKLIENIPLNGRKFQDLSLLVPGTRSSNYYDPTKTEVGGISYGGLTGRSVIINVDGGDDNDGVVRGILQQYTAEAIEEYKVTTQRYSAEYGRSVGGVVNVITKSGTNDYHGSAFVFARDQRLNSLTYFQQQQGSTKPPFKQQEFGGSIGGPIEKDKAHFFVAYERNRRDDYQTVSTGGLLPAQEGNFPQPFRNHLLSAKVDVKVDDRNTMLARYALEDNNVQHDFIGGNTLASAGATNSNKIHTAILKNTTVFGNSKLNEFSAEFQHFENDIAAENPSIPGVRTPDFVFGANLNTPQQTIQRRIQVQDDFSFRKEMGGDHNFKVGAQLIASHFGGFFVPTLYGLFTFAHRVGNGSDVNAYLNGIADSFSGSAGNNSFDDNWTYVAGYVQDDYKPTSRLTLNLGVRYDIQYGPYTNRFDTAPLRALAAAGSPSTRHQDYGDVAPRVGFAYDVNGNAKLVIRGGYGRYYDEIFQNITLYEYWSQVNSPTNFLSLSPAPFTPNSYAANRDSIRQSLVDPTFKGQLLRLTSPDLTQPRSDQENVGFSIQPLKELAFDVDYVHATGSNEIARWRINTPSNVNTRVSPAGVFAPQFGGINVEGNRGHSTFDGVYVVGKVRTTKTTLLMTYAFTKTKNQANDFNSVPSDITNANFDLDYGPSPNDVEQRFTAGAVFQLPVGFQYSTSFQANTGRPFTALAGLAGLRASVRAIDPATGLPFTRGSFRAGPAQVTSQGGTGGLAFLTWDMRLSKTFKFGKAMSLEVLAEVFNLTNHANFDRDKYVTNFNSPHFGQATAIILNSERQGELGVRFRF